MSDRKPLTSEEISAIVDGLNSMNWKQMELMAKLPTEKRMYPSLQASAMIRAGLRTAFKRKFPELSMLEINMKILERLILMDKKYEHGGVSNYKVDIEEIADQAVCLGPETLDMWNKTLARARAEIEKGDTPRKW